MKKTYMKPKVSFENFSLCVSTSAGCEKISENPALWTCGVIMGFDSIFSSGVSGCGIELTEDDYYAITGDHLCYHNPTPDNNLFNS